MAALIHEADHDAIEAAAYADLRARGELAPASTEFERRVLAAHQGTRTPAEVQYGETWVMDPLYREVVRRGWFVRSPDEAAFGPRLWAGLLLPLGGLCIFLGVHPGTVGQLHGITVPFGILLILIGLAARAGARRRPVRTPQGRALAVQLAGFAHYLRTLGPQQARSVMGERYDALAIALGLEGWRQIVTPHHRASRPRRVRPP